MVCDRLEVEKVTKEINNHAVTLDQIDIYIYIYIHI